MEKIESLVKQKKLNPAELKKALGVDYDPWELVKGLLKHKKIQPLKYQKQIRKEWEK